MAKRVIKIQEIRPGAKGPRWQKKFAWNNANAALARRLATIERKLPKAEEIVSILRRLEGKAGTNWKETEKMERGLAGERKKLKDISRALANQIRQGKILGEKTSQLKAEQRRVKENLSMINTLLAEIASLWAEHPEVLRLVREIRKTHPRPTQGKGQRKKPKRKPRTRGNQGKRRS